jgi:DNA polymerase III delta prime subunit
MELYFNFINDLSLFFTKIFVLALVFMLFFVLVGVVFYAFLDKIIEYIDLKKVKNLQYQAFVSELDQDIQNLKKSASEEFFNKFRRFLEKYKVNIVNILDLFDGQERKIIEDWVFKDIKDEKLEPILKSHLAKIKQYILSNKQLDIYVDLGQFETATNS